jgi:hypothetical protein
MNRISYTLALTRRQDLLEEAAQRRLAKTSSRVEATPRRTPRRRRTGRARLRFVGQD